MKATERVAVRLGIGILAKDLDVPVAAVERMPWAEVEAHIERIRQRNRAAGRDVAVLAVLAERARYAYETYNIDPARTPTPAAALEAGLLPAEAAGWFDPASVTAAEIDALLEAWAAGDGEAEAEDAGGREIMVPLNIMTSWNEDGDAETYVRIGDATPEQIEGHIADVTRLAEALADEAEHLDLYLEQLRRTGKRPEFTTPGDAHETSEDATRAALEAALEAEGAANSSPDEG